MVHQINTKADEKIERDGLLPHLEDEDGEEYK